MSKTKKISNSVYTMPIVPFLDGAGEWEAFLGTEADPVFSFRLQIAPVRVSEDGSTHWERAPFRRIEPFAMREQFFLIRTAEDALQFFRENGPYQLAKEGATVAAPVKLSQVLRQRDFFEDALLHRSVENLNRSYEGDEVREGFDNIYLWQPLPMELIFRNPMKAMVRCKDVQDALRATIFLDRLRAMPWRRCAREDCGKSFAVKTRRDQIYCGTDCAHLQSVRNYNKRQRSAKAAKAAKPMQARKSTTKKARG